MNNIAFLEQVEALLRDKFGHATLAQNEQGRAVDPLAADASTFCVMGSIARIGGVQGLEMRDYYELSAWPSELRPVLDALHVAAVALHQDYIDGPVPDLASLVWVNDNRGRDAVLAVIAKAKLALQ